MKVWPLRYRPFGEDTLIFADETGGFFRASDAFLKRYAFGDLNETDFAFLDAGGHAYEVEGDLAHTAFAARWAQRNSFVSELSYLILVPTLRCDLTCSYCQVSRASAHAAGYDWTEETTSAVLALLEGLTSPRIKIEFQGGEPLLRLDRLERIRTFCRERFETSEFVVCTNLQNVSEDAWSFLAASDTFTSTSLDGPQPYHAARRTGASGAEQFFENLRKAAALLGPNRISALPTIDPRVPPDFDALIDAYEEIGLASIYLRPINFQGFARKGPRHDIASWNHLSARFIEHLIERNFRTGRIVEEYYFSQCLKRVLRAGEDGHVDLRNPNLFGSSYLLVDHQGLLFPTDEARMLHRIGHIDLSIGHVTSGIDRDKISALNAYSFNNFDPDCVHCPYQAFCGSDPVDDISRYNRIDVPRNQTWFCGRQTAIFDLVFELLYRNDEKTRFSLARWAGLQDLPAELTPVHQ